MDSPSLSRRGFLADMGMGFTGLALGAMLARDEGVRAGAPAAWSPPDGRPHFAPKAKSVIWLFMVGGISHMESFDPKPELNKLRRQDDRRNAVQAPSSIRRTCSKNLRSRPRPAQGASQHLSAAGRLPQARPERHGDQRLVAARRRLRRRPRRGPLACGRPTTTTAPSCSSTPAGTCSKGAFPTIGSWVHYGLGSLNDNLPQFVVLGTPLADCCGGVDGARRALPRPRARRRPLARRSGKPAALRRARRRTCSARSSAAEFDLLGRLNRLPAIEYPDDPALRARIKSYELAFRMQTAVPEVLQLRRRRPQRHARLYGLDQRTTRPSASTAWRPAGWSSTACASCRSSTAQRRRRRLGRPRQPESGPRQLCGQVDKPIAGLLKDLKQRGLLDETLVVWGTEFGRTPGAQGSDGRDHHPYGFSRLAGRRRHQGRRRPRRHRRARLPRRRKPPLRHRHPRHGAAPARPGLAPAGSAGPQAAGDRLRQADPGDHRLIHAPGEGVTSRLRVRLRFSSPKRRRGGGEPASGEQTGHFHRVRLCAPRWEPTSREKWCLPKPTRVRFAVLGWLCAGPCSPTCTDSASRFRTKRFATTCC